MVNVSWILPEIIWWLEHTRAMCEVRRWEGPGSAFVRHSPFRLSSSRRRQRRYVEKEKVKENKSRKRKGESSLGEGKIWCFHEVPVLQHGLGKFPASLAFGSGLGTLTIILEGRKRSKLCIIQKNELKYMYRHMIPSLYMILNKPEQVVLERSARLNMDPGRVD